MRARLNSLVTRTGLSQSNLRRLDKNMGRKKDKDEESSEGFLELSSPHKKMKHKHKKHKKKRERTSSNGEEIDVVGLDMRKDSAAAATTVGGFGGGFGSLKLKIKFGGETVSTAQVVNVDKVETASYQMINKSEKKLKRLKEINEDFEDDDIMGKMKEISEIDVGSNCEDSLQTIEYEEADFSDDEESRKTLDESISDSQSQISQTKQTLDDDEESKWLDALEAGELDDMGRLKKEKDVSLMTTRQRALYGHNVEGETELMELPIWEKRRDESSEEAQLRRKQRAKKRKQQMQKQIEETKAQTINKLLNKQATKGKKETKSSAKLKKLGAHVRYVSGINGASVSLSKGIEYPLQSQLPRNPPDVVKCAVEGCNNKKTYSCSKTKLPICGLNCYKIIQKMNLASQLVT